MCGSAQRRAATGQGNAESARVGSRSDGENETGALVDELSQAETDF